MTVDKDGWTEVRLLEVGESSRTGNVYSAAVINDALERLKKHPNLRGQVAPTRDPYSINEDKVSHRFDVASLHLKDGYLVGKFTPAGPQAAFLKEMLNTPPISLAMRSLVSYASDQKTVEKLHIVSFDLCNLPPL